MKIPLLKIVIETSLIKKTETKLEIYALSHHVFYFFYLFFLIPQFYLSKQYRTEFLRIWMVQQKLHSGQESNEENGY